MISEEQVYESDVILYWDDDGCMRALGIVYDRDFDIAPRITWKATGLEAFRGIWISRGAEIATRHLKMTCDLYRKCLTGDYIPEEYYDAMAKVLVKVYVEFANRRKESE